MAVHLGASVREAIQLAERVGKHDAVLLPALKLGNLIGTGPIWFDDVLATTP